MHGHFLSGVLQHQRNGGLNSGLKSANIVTQCNMLFKIFGKVQNYAKSTVRPNGPKQARVAGHHPMTLQKHDKYGRESSLQYPKCAYDLYHIRIGLGSETARNGQYKRLTEKMRVMGRKNKA